MARELIAERIAIGRRYVRAVDILRDLEDPQALKGYVLTPSVRDGLRRVLGGLGKGSSQRAFRVTGPYGSGKSSFGLLLARLFQEGTEGGPATNLARDLLGGQQVPAYRPIVIAGRRASLAGDLAAAARDFARVEFGENDELGVSATRELDRQRGSGRSDVKAVLDGLARCSGRLYAESGRGLLLLIDEMGRYVEFAVSNPEPGRPFGVSATRRAGQAGREATDWPWSVSCTIDSATTWRRWATGSRGSGGDLRSVMRRSRSMRAMNSCSTFCRRHWSLGAHTAAQSRARRVPTTGRQGSEGCSPWRATISWRWGSNYTHFIRVRLRVSGRVRGASGRTNARSSPSCSRRSRLGTRSSRTGRVTPAHELVSDRRRLRPSGVARVVAIPEQGP